VKQIEGFVVEYRIEAMMRDTEGRYSGVNGGQEYSQVVIRPNICRGIGSHAVITLLTL